MDDRQATIEALIEAGLTPEEAEETQAAAERIERERREEAFRQRREDAPRGAIEERLDYLRGEIEAERISYGEIAELQGLAPFIDPSDVVLLEWAGVEEEDAKACSEAWDDTGWCVRHEVTHGSTIATDTGVVIAEQRHVEAWDAEQRAFEQERDFFEEPYGTQPGEETEPQGLGVFGDRCECGQKLGH